MNELVNVKAEKINNEIESLNQNEIMEEVKMTTAETKLQAVEERSEEHTSELRHWNKSRMPSSA